MGADETRLGERGGEASEGAEVDENAEVGADAGGDWNFLHEELVPALVVGGVLLVLFPDPVTTTVGLALVTVAVVLWARDLVR